MDHAGRLNRLRAALQRPLLVSSTVNLRYLTGFTGSNGFLMIGDDGVVFVTDGRYGEVAGGLVADLDDVRVEVYSAGLPDALAGVAPAGALEIEAAHVSWEFVNSLADLYGGELVAGGGRVERLRLVKDADELMALRAAATAGDAAFSRLTEIWRNAGTEHDVAEGLIRAMEAAGADRTEWAPIVASGAHAARPHHREGPGAARSGRD